MLDTDLRHLEADEEVRTVLDENENVMICCGRMGPMCIPVYRIMEDLEAAYSHVAFRDMDFDIGPARFIRGLPECATFQGLPFTVYFRKGEVAVATTSLQSREQVVEILNREFGEPGAA